MPRESLDLLDPNDLKLLGVQWRFAPGLVPGEANEGLVSQLSGSPARLPDYDDSNWDEGRDLRDWVSRGLTFAWYRLHLTIPATVGGRNIEGSRCLLETCIDDYGEIWIDGEIDRNRGAVQGFNVPQRVWLSNDPHGGDQHCIALLAANGPLAAPGGAVFVRFVTLAFEWPILNY